MQTKGIKAMSIIATNIKFLRKYSGLTQEDFADKIGVKRSMIGSYEEDRAIPKLSVLQDIANYFSITIDYLINIKLNNDLYPDIQDNDLSTYTKGNNLRVVSTVVNKEDKELITTVPIQASAGYTKGYADSGYIEELPHFSMPLIELSKDRTYRIFQIKGDSMEPVKSGSYIICEYLLNWGAILNGKPYILITKYDGIVYKRLYNKINETSEIVLQSDNPEYQTYSINVENVFEIWKALGFISFDLTEPKELDTNKLYEMIVNLQNEIKAFKR